jgi:hypothetical protein
MLDAKSLYSTDTQKHKTERSRTKGRKKVRKEETRLVKCALRKALKFLCSSRHIIGDDVIRATKGITYARTVTRETVVPEVLFAQQYYPRSQSQQCGTRSLVR